MGQGSQDSPLATGPPCRELLIDSHPLPAVTLRNLLYLVIWLGNRSEVPELLLLRISTALGPMGPCEPTDLWETASRIPEIGRAHV